MARVDECVVNERDHASDDGGGGRGTTDHLAAAVLDRVVARRVGGQVGHAAARRVQIACGPRAARLFKEMADGRRLVRRRGVGVEGGEAASRLAVDTDPRALEDGAPGGTADRRDVRGGCRVLLAVDEARVA